MVIEILTVLFYLSIAIPFLFMIVDVFYGIVINGYRRIKPRLRPVLVMIKTPSITQ